MRKRQKLVLTSVILLIGLVGEQFAPLEIKYPIIAILFALAWGLATWSLKEGISGIEWFTIPLPPALFVVSVGLFYILLPSAWWAKILILLLFGIGEYALLLSANIFSVAKIRTIALQRAAVAISLVMTLLMGFLLFNTIWSLRMPFWLVGIMSGVVSYLLLFPTLWSMKLESTLSKQLLQYSAWMAVCVAILAMVVAFWPVGVTVASVFLCTMLYVFLGIAQHHFEDRLFAKTVGEYVLIIGVVLVTMLLTSGIN